jgi:hypothetical protein
VVTALEVLRRYFGCLESGEFVEAARCFSASARYSHPPYAGDPPGAGRHEAYGRDAILALFHRRGFRRTRHEIIATAGTDDRWFASGLVADGAGEIVASFVAEARFHRGLGQFTEYAAYSSRPAVWAETRRGEI